VYQWKMMDQHQDGEVISITPNGMGQVIAGGTPAELADLILWQLEDPEIGELLYQLKVGRQQLKDRIAMYDGTQSK
jgi:hypothetical protein